MFSSIRWVRFQLDTFLEGRRLQWGDFFLLISAKAFMGWIPRRGLCVLHLEKKQWRSSVTLVKVPIWNLTWTALKAEIHTFYRDSTFIWISLWGSRPPPQSGSFYLAITPKLCSAAMIVSLRTSPNYKDPLFINFRIKCDKIDYNTMHSNIMKI